MDVKEVPCTLLSMDFFDRLFSEGTSSQHLLYTVQSILCYTDSILEYIYFAYVSTLHGVCMVLL